MTTFRIAAVAALALAAAGCTESLSEREDPLAQDIIDEAQLSALLLTSGDPQVAVSYFETALAREPERADFRRGLAQAYVRAGRFPEAARVYDELDTLGQATAEDRLEYAYVAVRLGKWEEAERVAAGLPAGLTTSRRYVMDAMLADHAKDWDRADQAYAQAEGLAPNPAEVLNNWGVSLMSRGELTRAEAVLERAVSFDSTVFSAKNNLAISRGLRGDYRLPLVPLTAEERAVITHNLGLIALRQGDVRRARGLFATAVETHPRYYPAAADKLAQLDNTLR
ncbi:MAG: tetratricopeptide repeat protein [Pseudomonadota bacterium]